MVTNSMHCWKVYCVQVYKGKFPTSTDNRIPPHFVSQNVLIPFAHTPELPTCLSSYFPEATGHPPSATLELDLYCYTLSFCMFRLSTPGADHTSMPAG